MISARVAKTMGEAAIAGATWAGSAVGVAAWIDAAKTQGLVARS